MEGGKKGNEPSEPGYSDPGEYGEESRIALPHDQRGKIVRLRDIQDILEFDHEVRKVTSYLPLPIRVGCLLRTPLCSWPNFGIEVTAGNIGALEGYANDKYLRDAKDNKKVKTGQDLLWKAKKYLGEGNLEGMAQHAAMLISELLLAMDDGKRKFSICDLASGAGRLSQKIAVSLRAEPGDILDRVTFHVVDYTDKLKLAKVNLESYGVRVKDHNQIDDHFLESTDEEFDFVASISHLHRKPVIASHLERVRKVLKEDGVLVSADRHSLLTQHPNTLLDLLQMLNVKTEDIDRFRSLFGPLMILNDPYELFDDEEDEMANTEFTAMNDHGRYWAALTNRLAGIRYDGPLKVRITGAFLSTRQMVKELNSAGFDTDIEKIRLAFPTARLPARMPYSLKKGSDSPAVTMGIKKRCSE